LISQLTGDSDPLSGGTDASQIVGPTFGQ